jgi:hypothetical protein
MWKINNNAINRATVWNPSVWGPQAQCCTPLPSWQVEFLLHKMFPFKKFQDISNQFFQGKPTFPEHGECCQDYGGGPFE